MRRVFSGWDIRLRLAAALVWLCGLVFLKNPLMIAALGVLIGIIIAIDPDMSFKEAMHNMLHILPLILIMALSLALSGGIPLQKDAVMDAVLVCMRVVLAILVILAMTAGSSAEEFIRGIAVLPIPPLLLSLMFMVNRCIVLLVREFRMQAMALKSRMFVPKANPASLRNIGYVIGGMFIRSYDRSEKMYDAMKARCYAGVIPFEKAGKTGLLDWIKLLAASLLFVCAILLERRAGL